MPEHIAIAEIPQDERTELLLQQAADLLFTEIDVKAMGDTSPDDLFAREITRERFSYNRLFVAVNEAGNVVGAATLNTNSIPEAQLSDIAVAPEYRRQHIGDKLLTSAENAAKVAGADTMKLYHLESAVPFYLAKGFELKTDEDGDLMTKTLK
jgi:ribosomal protein S18 acetylase RimI-like enzyme